MIENDANGLQNFAQNDSGNGTGQINDEIPSLEGTTTDELKVHEVDVDRDRQLSEMLESALSSTTADNMKAGLAEFVIAADEYACEQHKQRMAKYDETLEALGITRDESQEKVDAMLEELGKEYSDIRQQARRREAEERLNIQRPLGRNFQTMEPPYNEQEMRRRTELDSQCLALDSIHDPGRPGLAVEIRDEFNTLNVRTLRDLEAQEDLSLIPQGFREEVNTPVLGKMIRKAIPVNETITIYTSEKPRSLKDLGGEQVGRIEVSIFKGQDKKGVNSYGNFSIQYSRYGDDVRLGNGDYYTDRPENET